MAGNGLNLKEIAEIRRLWRLGLFNRQIAKALRIHRNTVNKYVDIFRAEGAAVVSPSVAVETSDAAAGIDWERVRSEYLGGVPLTVIHEELLDQNKTKIQYAGFWKQAKKNISLTEASIPRFQERCRAS